MMSACTALPPKYAMPAARNIGIVSDGMPRERSTEPRELSLRRLHAFGGIKRGEHDALVAGAAAEVSGDGDPHLPLGRVGIVAQEFQQRGEHARLAEATLQ